MKDTVSAVMGTCVEYQRHAEEVTRKSHPYEGLRDSWVRVPGGNILSAVQVWVGLADVKGVRKVWGGDELDIGEAIHKGLWAKFGWHGMRGPTCNACLSWMVFKQSACSNTHTLAMLGAITEHWPERLLVAFSSLAVPSQCPTASTPSLPPSCFRALQFRE